MTRRQEVENIIIGTLLSSDSQDNFFESCRCCITEDMFSDEVNRRLFRMVSEMNKAGNPETDPYSILMTYGDEVKDIVYRMCELSCEFSFLHKKTQYNERQFLIWVSYGFKPNYTHVTFDDYVNRFIQLVFSNEKEGEDRDYVRS